MQATEIYLLGLLALVLFLPFLVRKVEENLELFLFAMGIAAMSLGAQWNRHVIEEALVEPIKITIAVLLAGLAFKFLRGFLRRAVASAISRLGLKAFAFCVVAALGLASSLITAIVAALVLVEVVDCMSLDRKDEIKLVVVACFAIGMGAVLTPLGEPLATIVIAKLKGQPYDAGFWFLFEEYWAFVVPGILLCGALAALIVRRGATDEGLKEDREERLGDIILRAGKTYLFVMALVFLGTGFKPIVEAYVAELPAAGLFWINSISAILDNATLAAAEITPALTRSQLDFALLSLVVSGGMMIPGNIPNIIAAGKLRIASKEWIAVGVPVGAGMMAACFAALLIARA